MSQQLPSYGMPIMRVDLAELIAAISGSGSFVTSVTGTANQVTVAPNTGAVVVSLPSGGTLPGAWTVATGFTVTAGGLTVTAGGATITAGNVTLTAGNLVFGAASAKIIPGATSLLFRNNADGATNLGITDAGVVTLRNQMVNTGASVVSAPAGTYTGAWFTGGTATTTKPHVLIEPTGATSTGWSTLGTGLGVNAASGFAGNLLDLQLDGVWKLRFDGTSNGQTYLNLGGSSSNINAANLILGSTSDIFTFYGLNGNSFGTISRGSSGTGFTFSTIVQTVLSATTGAGFRLPHGSAPTSPVNGDMWTTTAGLFVRINGVTVGPLS